MQNFLGACHQRCQGIYISGALPSTAKETTFFLAVSFWPPRKVPPAKVIPVWCSDLHPNYTSKPCSVIFSRFIYFFAKILMAYPCPINHVDYCTLIWIYIHYKKNKTFILISISQKTLPLTQLFLQDVVVVVGPYEVF